ncbi:MAG TPA: lipoprotein insertase outer membrane protein LolB [Gammaproteobacteria bacterium]|nr:lipoprotein insertase outer membrane protein LolB [Gammaproteobacteria bacterium]
MVNWLCAAAALCLAACASLEPETEPDSDLSYEARENQLRAITQWEMRGRIAVDTGTQARQGRFTWWQDGESLRVVIRGPLGAQSVEISGDGDLLRLRARRETRTLRDPEAQLSELLGWWLPITSLPSWLLGLPDPRFPMEATLVDSALLRGLDQRAWTMTYTQYENRGPVVIPSGITFTHAPLELVVTIDDWVALADTSLELDGGRPAQ